MADPRAAGARPGRRFPILLLLAGLAALGWIAGCVSTVTPPADPEDPETVYLVTGACHAGVVLPDPAGGMVDFTYGDWDWYAMNHDRWYHVFDTVLWPTCATLGRERLVTRDPQGIRARYPGHVVQPFRAARDRVTRLRLALEARFRAHLADVVYNERWKLSFVPLGRSYWFVNNCNDMTAAWLRELGCSVSWVPVRLGLGLAAAPGD
jgi:hypothetical protein